ncbi:MAG: M15 family metallopeptidase [Rickettsiales bacterium]|nr:M15 family metallopeptidase [Rickettsiales bacterium]
MFTVSTIPSELEHTMKKHNIWSDDCPIPIERLRLLTLSYIDMDDTPKHDGKLVILDATADYVIAIFRTLYDMGFPIDNMNTIDFYHGNDEASMADNNSSAFNFRAIEGQEDMISVHSYGTAIDINPKQNPYIILTDEDTPNVFVYPPAGKYFINRTNHRKGMVEPIVDVFKHHGFPVWGGNWNDPLDWHHFQTSRLVAELLSSMTPEHATDFFTLTTQYPLFFSISTDRDRINTKLIQSYDAAPDQFLEQLTTFLKTNKGLITKENAIEYYEKLVAFLGSVVIF